MQVDWWMCKHETISTKKFAFLIVILWIKESLYFIIFQTLLNFIFRADPRNGYWQCSDCCGRMLFLTSSFLPDKNSQICIKIALRTTTFTSTNKKHHFITSIICSNMNKRHSQHIYNIKQSRNINIRNIYFIVKIDDGNCIREIGSVWLLPI